MWYLLAPVLLGVLFGVAGAVGLRLLGRGPTVGLDRRSALLTVTAAGVASLAVIAIRGGAVGAMHSPAFSAYPFELLATVRYLLPLALGVLVVLALAVPAPQEGSVGASLARRTWSSFVPRAWTAVVLGVLGVVLAVTVAAGLASRPDEEGRYTRYDFGFDSSSMSTDFYGWHHSSGPLLCLVLLLAVTVAAWTVIARPPHPAERADLEEDVDRRRLRSTNVARIATGAMLLHLATVLGDLAGTAASSLTASAGSGEHFRSVPPFASLAPLMELGALLAGAIGLGLWVFTTLSALRGTRPRGGVRHDGAPSAESA
ncbi:hypothetical protein ACT3SP_11265 [Brachybacterium sp. AOP43-C2-M15]|uniref:hypothetical protein n=1 Tax=Brachybacterium sp. AOP43-C2-M15 TaxID=3457661 RepID=UPI004033634A